MREVVAVARSASASASSIAVSLAVRHDFEFGPSARFARALVEAALAEPLPPNMLLNVNVPPGIEPEEWIASRQGKHSYGADVVEKTDPRGRKYYWIGGNEYQHEDIPGSDCNAVLEDGRVAVTPLTLDFTDYAVRSRIGEWALKGFDRHDA